MNLDFSDIKVLLIGDFMVDHYIIGTSNRRSPEAPVPVVIPKKDYSIPGGAGNVAMNLSLLGANVMCVGCIGNDIWGEKLLSILKNEGIKTEGIELIDAMSGFECIIIDDMDNFITSEGIELQLFDIQKNKSLE